MMRALNLHLTTGLARLARCQIGAMAVEAAIIAPMLITLTIGGFEVGSIVARQTELQSAAAEAAAVVRASVPETEAERTTIRDIVRASTGLTTSQVSVVEVYRCGTSTSYVTNNSNCNGSGGGEVSTYVRLTMADTYQPIWTEFGLGTALTLNLTRTILVG
jgi:Flp pilus assembly protein TadG